MNNRAEARAIEPMPAGELIDLSGYHERRTATERLAPARGATILFFTGVRYERMDDTPLREAL